MKQSNGFVQEPMATPEPDEEVIQEDHQANNIAAVNQPETQEFSLAIKPKGTPLFKLRQVIIFSFLSFLSLEFSLVDILWSVDIPVPASLFYC